ncbi:MAG TPA: hypothetical protein VD833_04785 [Vicinamibacterales bacterium]|nr:hypothetical protein [Vicinamibacterales bacterium]
MAIRRALDARPGTLPEIRPDGNSVKFLIDIPTVRYIPRLVLRCDGDGNVWASIADGDRRDCGDRTE